MQISILGIIWIIILLVSFSKKIKYTLFLLIFSFVFQSAWLIKFSNIDINASILTSLFFIIRVLFLKKSQIKIPRWGINGLIFVFVTLIVSIISPLIFSGMQLTTMTNIGYNYNKTDIVTVSFSLSNLTLGLSILLYIVDAIMIYNVNFNIKWIEFEEVYKNIFVFVSIIGILHVVFTFLGLPTNFLRELFHNEYMILGNTYFDLLLIPEYRFARLMATFYEPSFCGAYLATVLIFLYFSKIRNKKFYSSLCIIDLLLCLASTGFASLIITVLIISIIKIISKDFSFKKILNIVFPSLFIIILCFFNNKIKELLYKFTIGKMGSASYEVRSIVNRYSLEAFFKTYGLGIGGNIFGAYSLFYSLLAQVGVIGFMTYVMFMKSIFMSNIKIKNSQTKWQIISVVLVPLVASLLSCQAFNFCVLWMGICIFSLYNSIDKYNSKSVNSN